MQPRLKIAGQPATDPEGWAVFLEGQLEDDTFHAERLTVKAWAGGIEPKILVTTALPGRIGIPDAFLQADGSGDFRWKTSEEIEAALQNELLKNLRDEAIRRLRSIELAWDLDQSGGGTLNADFLGLKAQGKAVVHGHASIHLLALLSPKEAEVYGGLHADISLGVAFDASLTDGGTRISATRSCSLHLRLGAEVALALSLDELNLSLPEFSLPLDQFANFDLKNLQLLEFPAVPGAMQDFAGVLNRLGKYIKGEYGQLKVSYEWNNAAGTATDPKLALHWDTSHGLCFAIVAAGPTDPEFKLPDFANAEADLLPLLANLTATISTTLGTPLVTISNGRFACGETAKIFVASVHVEPVNLPDIQGGSRPLGPLLIEWSAVKVKLTSEPIAIGTGTNLEPDDITLRAVLTFSRISISLTDDPGSVLAFSGEIELTPSGSRVKSLALLEPYPLELVHQTGAALLRGARQVLQLLARLEAGVGELEKLRKIQELLRVLSRIAGGIARARAFLSDSVGDLLDSAVSGVSELANSLIDKLSDLASNLDGSAFALDIDIRVALDPFELRQIMLTWSGPESVNKTASLDALGFRLQIGTGWRPALLLDVVDNPGIYFMAVADSGKTGAELASLSTDLWLRDESDPKNPSVAPVRDADSKSGDRPTEKEDPLLKIIATDPRGPGGQAIFVIAGLSRGRGVFLKRVLQENYRVNLPSGAPKIQVLKGPFTLVNPGSDAIKLDVEFEVKRVLPFFGMGETGQTTDFLKDLQSKLGQVVSVKGTKGPSIDLSNRTASLGLIMDVKAAGLTTELTMDLVLNLDTFDVTFKAPDALGMKSQRIQERALGLTWVVEQKDGALREANAEVEMFKMSFANGESGFELNDDVARMELHFDELSSDGQGVVLKVESFKVGRNGLDLIAKVDGEKPVKLNGLDVPFRFTTGGFSIRSSKLVEAVIGGRGQLPPDLIGETDCTVNLAFTESPGKGIILQSGKVEIDKKGDPIVCHTTRFTLTITDLDIGFAADGGYHFYLLITGSLRFTPKDGEFADGLLKHLADVEFSLERAPLTKDPRVLMRHISFQKTLNPKRELTLFNIFRFELRGFGFHPASPKFEGSPAINISGQINMGFGDVMQPKIDFHGLWVAPPQAGESLPRIRADGLGIELQMAGAVKVRGTLLAVDEDTRTVEGRDIMPPGFNASGFLGEGAVDIPGWGSMQATLGFLEVASATEPGTRKPSFFFYLQANQIAVEIPTPFWTFYLREAGFGFGYRYTLAGIKQAETATSAAQLIKTLDDVSRYQGDLHRFSAWNPDPDGDKFTLALKGGLQTAPAEKTYDATREEKAENPFFFDLVVALRSDFTFLMSARVHLGVNYFHYQKNTDDFRANPLMRGFLYISVPRRELLLRAVSDPGGFIGEDSALFKTGSLLREAVRSVKFSATMYIRPGLFQYELGWPDQLEVTLVKKPNMGLKVTGGMIFRAAEDGLLYGFNVGAEAFIVFTGRAGRSLGVAVEATLNAKLTARFIAYLAWRFSDSLVYALVSVDAQLRFSVSAWMEIDLGFKSFTLRIGFSFSVTFSAAVELAITPQGIGGQVHARIAVQAFGCTLSVGIGFAFDNNRVNEARARVARFMAMSLTAEEPGAPPLLAATAGNDAVNKAADLQRKIADAPTESVVTKPKVGETVKPEIIRAPFGREIGKTRFWLLIRRGKCPPQFEKEFEKKKIDPNTYVYATLVPREAESCKHGGFYAAPEEILDEAKPWQRKNLSSAHTIHFRKTPGVYAFNPGSRQFAPLPPEASKGRFNYPAPARWAADITREVPAGRFTLAHFFDECFLADTRWTYADKKTAEDRIAEKWREPRTCRRHGQPNVLKAEGGKTTEQQRDDHQRERAAEAELNKFDENAYQNRSTVLTMFLDQFVDFTKLGGRDAADLAQEDKALAHVTDLGMVFYGPLEEIMKLQGATVTKQDGSRGKHGVIVTLNPREHWFDNVDPILGADRNEIHADGIKLDWKLSLPFPNLTALSGDTRSNPEQYLHYYEITRTLVSGQIKLDPVTFQVKPAASIGKRNGNGDVTLVAGDWQFVDSMQGEELGAAMDEIREALLPPTGGGDALAAAKAWLKVFKNEEQVTVGYNVTPVDIAGVCGAPKSFAVKVRRPQPPVRPALAELRVRQDFAHTTSSSLTRVYLAINDSAWDRDEYNQNFGDRTYHITRHYRLVIQQEEIEPSGHYGSDGATARLRGSATLAPPRHDGEKWVELGWHDEGRNDSGSLSSADSSVLATLEKELKLKEDDIKKFDLWARLTPNGGRDDTMPDGIDRKQQQKLLAALEGVDLANPLATRFVLETRIRFTSEVGKVELELVSNRVPVQIEQIIVGPENTNSQKEPRLPSIIRPEALELVRPVDLPCPTPGQVHADCGFLSVMAPEADGRLSDWLAKDNKRLVMIRDPERRILTTVRFAAVPKGVMRVPGALGDAALISSYDLYELELVQLAATGEKPQRLHKNDKAWQLANCVGRIEQLSPEEASLTPDSNKELMNWQASYPSETHRVKGTVKNSKDGPQDRPLRLPWYSPRETVAEFPGRLPRICLFAQVPEDFLSELMNGPSPDRLALTLQPAGGSKAAKLFPDEKTLPKVKLVERKIAPLPPVGEISVLHDPNDKTRQLCDRLLSFDLATASFSRKDMRPMGMHDLRNALMSAGSRIFDPADPEAAKALEAWRKDPTQLEGLELVATAYWTVRPLTGNGEKNSSKEKEHKRSATIALDLRSAVHPLVEEVLGDLSYQWTPEKDELYRPYTVTVQPPPAMTAVRLGDFLAKTPPVSDPYGWGILQSLGLAAAIRIFDSHSDKFLDPHTLASNVNSAFSAALKRWKNEYPDDYFPELIGQPFVEVHLKPGRGCEPVPFNSVIGENGAVEKEAPIGSPNDDALALLQLSLRPRPKQVWTYHTCQFARRPIDMGKPEWAEVDGRWEDIDPEKWVILGEDGKPMPLAKGTHLQGTIIVRKSIRVLHLEVATAHPMPGHLAWLRGGPIMDLLTKKPVLKEGAPDPHYPRLAVPSVAASYPDEKQPDPDLKLVLRTAKRTSADQDPSIPTDKEITVVYEVVETKEFIIKTIDQSGQIKEGAFQVSKTPEQAITRTTKTALLSESTSPLTRGNWLEITQPAATWPDPYERFKELTPAEWALAFRTNDAAKRAYNALRYTMAAAAPGIEVPDPGASESEEITLLVSATAAYLPWQQRFLDHAAGPDSVADEPSLAFAMLTSALPWKLAPESDGFLSLGLIHADRCSQSRAYAVRPVSRYQRVLEGVGLVDAADGVAKGTTSTEGLGYAVSISPRTEKVEPPMILGSRSVLWNGGAQGEDEVVEIVVARHAEESLAWSNRPLFARLGAPTSLLTFARIYRFPEWRIALTQQFENQYTPVTLPERIPERARRPAPLEEDDVKTRITGEILGEVTRVYPRLWKGAQIWRLDSIAPHYRVAAFASERAGIAVSKVAGILHDDLPRQKVKKLENSQPKPELRLETKRGRDGTDRVRVALSFRLITHQQMTPENSTAWSLRSNPHDVSWWPDPDIVYVVQRRGTVARETTKIREEDLEIRLGAFEVINSPPSSKPRYRLVQARTRGTAFLSNLDPDITLEDTPGPEEPGPISFTLTTWLDPVEPAKAEDRKVDSLRLTAEEAGDLGKITSFNGFAKEFAAILTPHDIQVDLPVDNDENGPETAELYFARLQEFAKELRARAEVALTPKDWKSDRLRVNLRASLRARIDELDEVIKAGIKPGDTAGQWYTRAGLPLTASGFHAPGADYPDLGLKTDWTQGGGSEAYLLVWDLAQDQTIEDLNQVTYPPVAHAGGRLRTILKRRVMGAASEFWLSVIDSRARMQTTKPLELGVKLPEWMDTP